MTLGSCLVSNQPHILKDALLQARIDGKSWAQIAEDFDFGSPSGARAAFKKITGISDFKIKGKELKAVLDNGMIDDLKVTVPKKVKVGIPEPSAGASVDDFLGGAKAGHISEVGADDTSSWSVMHKAFGNEKTFLQNTDEVKKFAFHQEQAFEAKYAARAEQLKQEMGIDKFSEVMKDLKGGGYYSNIVAKHGISFQEVDDINTYRLYFSKDGGTVWKTYALKPTSETGFKAVQDQVMNLRKFGATDTQIQEALGVPKKVYEMIVQDKWALPGKGASTYVGYETPPATGYSYSKPTQTVYELKGERNAFRDMTEHDANEWYHNLGKDLQPDEVSSIQRYTGSGYRSINDPLRGRNGMTPTATSERHAQNISSSMRPVPQNMTVYRGVGADTFPNGIPKPGDSFTDPGFLSTSFGGNAAFGGEYKLVIDVPAGARARPVHLISVQGSGEREVLLDRNQKYLVLGVLPGKGSFGSSQTTVFLRLLI